MLLGIFCLIVTGPRARTAGLVTLVLVVAVLLGGGGYLITRVLRAPQAAPTAPRSPLPAVAGPATQAPPSGSAGSAGTPPSPGAVARRLGPALTAAALGPQVRAQVTDVLTGTTLLDRDGAVPAPPASTAKLLTAVGGAGGPTTDGPVVDDGAARNRCRHRHRLPARRRRPDAHGRRTGHAPAPTPQAARLD